MTRWTARSEHICGASDPQHLARVQRFVDGVDGVLSTRDGVVHVELVVEAEDVLRAVTVAGVLLEAAGLRAHHMTRLQVLHDRRVVERRTDEQQAEVETPLPLARPGRLRSA
jgi:hypothetical protein